MLSTLLENKKFAQATHNIYAYRVLKDGLPGCMVQDCEDDGENAAGSRLLHLLQVVKLIHKMVVVIPDLCLLQRSVEFVRRGTAEMKVSAVTAWNFYPVEFVRRGTAEMKLSAVTAWNFYPVEFVRRGTAEWKVSAVTA
ncbi:hypothetical protein J6590_038857 [Homalodisca vitripennis]|nr:hypothetical protein J6590_038857 [Homalodisca vitripennis]